MQAILRVLLPAVLLLVSAMSGCAAKEGTKAADVANGEQAEDGSGVAGNATIDANASAVQAIIVVSIDGNETAAVNGSIPAVTNTNITFDASTSTGTNLTYAWDLGDGNSSTNKTVLYAFSQPGLYNVSLNVSAGNVSSVSSVSLNVTAGAAAGAVFWMDVKDFSGTLALNDPNSDSGTVPTSTATHAVTIVADKDGTAVVAKVARITLTTTSQTAPQVNLGWRDPSGATMASAAGNYGGADFENDHEIIYEAEMAAGDWNVFLRNMIGVAAQYTVHVEIDYAAV